MGLFEYLGSIVSTKRSLEYFIKSFEVSYWRHKKLFPDHNPHIYLSQAWLALMQAKGKDIDAPAIREASLTTTYQIACLPEPACARALGLFMAYRDRPEDFCKYPHLEEEFNDLIKPVLAAENAGKLEILYEQQNPSKES